MFGRQQSLSPKTQICLPGSSRSGESGTHEHELCLYTRGNRNSFALWSVFMDPGLAPMARPGEDNKGYRGNA